MVTITMNKTTHSWSAFVMPIFTRASGVVDGGFDALPIRGRRADAIATSYSGTRVWSPPLT